MTRRPTITDGMKLAVLKRDGLFYCAVCEMPLHLSTPRRWQYDHHLALVDKGKHAVSNLRLLCIACHKVKSAREHIANCKSKRIAAKRSGTYTKKKKTIPSRPLQSHSDPFGKKYRAKVEAKKS